MIWFKLRKLNDPIRIDCSIRTVNRHYSGLSDDGRGWWHDPGTYATRYDSTYGDANGTRHDSAGDEYASDANRDATYTGSDSDNTGDAAADIYSHGDAIDT